MPGIQELTPEALDVHLHRVADHLQHKFNDRTDEREIERAVFEEAQQFRGARVTQFIPVLVQHAVQERFRKRPRRRR